MPEAVAHDVYESIGAAVAAHGLVLRGGFRPAEGDAVPTGARGMATATVLMIGNTGGALWPAFKAARHVEANPLDRWVARVIEPIASAHGARAVYPYDTPPQPFQRWAKRAWPLHASPLGLLIDAEYGLWHALRAALLFAEPIAVPALPSVASPCDACVGKPCLTACPIGAFTAAGFAYQDCRAYLPTAAGASCFLTGCKARAACPVGRAHTYPPAQLAFHMQSFSGMTRQTTDV